MGRAPNFPQLTVKLMAEGKATDSLTRSHVAQEKRALPGGFTRGKTLISDKQPQKETSLWNYLER